MSKDKSFEEFNRKIRLTRSKRDKLKENRKILRNKVEDYFETRGLDVPIFRSQGSFSLRTNLNPIKKTEADGSVKEKYDLDDGVFFICPISERENADTYHGRVRAAVDGHTSEVKDKNTCVRVVYKDGHHIDLPAYWAESEDSIPQLAHKSKGFVDSDPKAFGDWVDRNVRNSGHSGQLRRIIRYLKAWKDSREHKNSSLKLPSGFILTILACNNYVGDESDAIALRNTVENIKNGLSCSFSCYSPTASEGEDLLAKYDQGTCLSEFEKFLKNAADAVNAGSGKQSSECWTKVFGGRFPSGGSSSSGSGGGSSGAKRATTSSPVAIKSSPLWAQD